MIYKIEIYKDKVKFQSLEFYDAGDVADAVAALSDLVDLGYTVQSYQVDQTNEIATLSTEVSAKVSEAPIDGNQYARKDAGWEEVIASGGVEEAPIDTKQYGRKDAGWTEVVAGGHTQNTDTNLGTLGTKNPPIDDDLTIYRDSEAASALKTSTWTQIKAFLKTYFDGLYSLLGHTHTGLHTQHTDTGTTGNTFTVDSDSTIGKIIVDVALGSADLSLTLTNEALTSSSKTITFPNATGTVSLLALGENSTNAYRGDRGKTAYDHSQAAHADIGADNTTAQLNGGSPDTPTAETKIITLETEVISNFSYGDLLKELDARYVQI